ncbi:MAG: hypothetical protein QOJ15_3415, partial [Bradyrhizobium sp.]|nr:hypothetical protein [Bradyrhizobium sp.]
TSYSCDIEAPRLTRSRMTMTGSRFPGSRVVASDHLPRELSNPQWYVWPSAIRLQLRGQPRNGLPEQAHRIPLDSPCGHHHRKPWHLTVMASTAQSSNMRKPRHGKIRFGAACHPC